MYECICIMRAEKKLMSTSYIQFLGMTIWPSTFHRKCMSSKENIFHILYLSKTSRKIQTDKDMRTYANKKGKRQRRHICWRAVAHTTCTHKKVYVIIHSTSNQDEWQSSEQLLHCFWSALANMRVSTIPRQSIPRDKQVTAMKRRTPPENGQAIGYNNTRPTKQIQQRAAQNRETGHNGLAAQVARRSS